MSEKPILAPMVAPLLTWYQQFARVLPWRSDPTPYHVWISEIMLQQTRVEAVKEYYARFLQELPDLESLAQVPEQKLLKLWEGLGYYSRARNLKKAAELVMEQYGGQLPSDPASLQKLPGIGAYTAGAIASIAFQVPAPAVDGNVLRILSRVMGDYSNVSQTQTKKKYEELLRQVYPLAAEQKSPGDFTQALMELGATVCVPNGEPRCLVCPWGDLCQAKKLGVIGELPVKDEKKARTIEKRTVLVLCSGNKVALRQRPKQGLLASLWEFPAVEGHLSQQQAKNLLNDWGMDVNGEIHSLGRAKHIFTHIEWNMIGFQAEVDCEGTESGLVWVERERLKEEYPIPNALKAYQKFL
ncbi:MAG: A/G-specific adenine glycosylase [Massiliimalia sp.]